MVDVTPEFEQALHSLAETVGVEISYWNIFGKWNVAKPEVLIALFSAMGYRADTVEACQESRRLIEEAPFRDLLPPVSVLRRGRPLLVALAIPHTCVGATATWTLSLESGIQRHGEWRLTEEAILDERHLAKGRVVRVNVALPDDIPDGYHDLRVSLDTTNQATARLVVAPDSCWLPDILLDEGRSWGLFCQLYSLRSKRDWGIGDFAALTTLAEAAGHQGADVIGVNPLHALFPSRTDLISPYSPSSRLFLNPLYIAVEEVPEFAASQKIQDKFATATYQRKLQKVRAEAFVDYEVVGTIKRAFFEQLFAEFEKNATPDRKAAFDAFVANGGRRLLLFAAFQVLERLHAPLPWTEWPTPFRNADSPEVEAFVAANQKDIRLELWLQFEADRQLAIADKTLHRSGGRIGLYRDLAVGVNPHGADAWIDPTVFVTKASAGAPPDALGPIGQVWGLPPMHPLRLREQAYAPYIEMVRANMRHAGALRIDHVMGLLHLFWVPSGFSALDGVYVGYPLDDFLGILALESHRQKCLVIGEDLGTVPDGLRERMARENLLSYRVFFFERWESGLYRRPDNYPRLALACATSHDMTPIAGFWRGWDIELRHSLGITPEDSTLDGDLTQRTIDREMLKAALVDQYMITPDFPEDRQISTDQEKDLILAVHSFLAHAPSALAMLNIDDVAAETSAVNVPGTLDEYPNWRRRLGIEIEDLVISDDFLSNAVGMMRGRSH